MSYEDQQKRISKLFELNIEENPDVSDFDDSSDSEFSNDLEDDDDQTEQCGMECNDENSPELNFMMGKDGVTKWGRKVGVRTIRTRSYNIVSHLPGAKHCGKNANLPIECFNSFFSNDIIQKIVYYTNMYIEKVEPAYENKLRCRKTDEEIHSFIGLLIIAGAIKSSKETFEVYFQKII